MNTSNTRFIDFSKPFVDGLKAVFETMVFTKIDCGKPAIKKDRVANGDISALINVHGIHKSAEKSQEFQAMLAITWTFETYVKVANQMLSEDNKDYCDGIADVGAEIVNIVTGNAKRDLNGQGFFATMSIPTTITGKNHTISYPPNTTIVSLPINSPLGNFFMEISYSDIVV